MEFLLQALVHSVQWVYMRVWVDGGSSSHWWFAEVMTYCVVQRDYLDTSWGNQDEKSLCCYLGSSRGKLLGLE